MLADFQICISAPLMKVETIIYIYDNDNKKFSYYQMFDCIP